MEIKTILWPTDLSESSNRALPYVETFSRQMGARIVALYVMEDLTRYQPYYGGQTREMAEQMIEWEMTEARRRLEETCRDRLGGCPGYRVEVVRSFPLKGILQAIAEFDADMVVMAPHGRRSEDLDFVIDIGSTTEKVVRYSSVPVLVVSERALPKA